MTRYAASPITPPYTSARTGMWVFLAMEIMLFIGLLAACVIARRNDPQTFEVGRRFLDVTLGAIGTVVLLASSVTMALAVRAARRDRPRLIAALLSLTLLAGGGFVTINAVEYARSTHMVPSPSQEEGGSTAPAVETGEGAAVEQAALSLVDDQRSAIAPAAAAPTGLAAPAHAESTAPLTAEQRDKARTYLAIYHAMAGLIVLHLLVGMGVIVWLIRRAARGDFSSRRFAALDLGAMYWHMITVVWLATLAAFSLIS